MHYSNVGSRRDTGGGRNPILVLNAAGYPANWVSIKTAVTVYVRGKVGWEAGQHYFDVKGGVQKLSGLSSSVRTNSIISVTGAIVVESMNETVGISSEAIYRRDRNVCAYCSEPYTRRELSLDHIHPESRGGRFTWMNLVTACRDCNSKKADRTPEEADMPLAYIPYIPNRFERFILGQRNILADQMEYLLAGVSRESRLLIN